jgi:hypothetical protein
MASGVNPKKIKMKSDSPNPKKNSNHLTLPNEMEGLKFSSEMRLKIKRKKWDPSHLFSIEGIK